MTTTNLFTKARNAALVSLALGIAAAGAFPSQAATLVEKQGPGSDKGSYDCLSRSEVKYYFRDYGLKHVEVSRTSERYLYKVTGYKELSKEPKLSDNGEFGSDLVKKDKFDKVRYVVLFDACEEKIVKQIAPPLKEAILE